MTAPTLTLWSKWLAMTGLFVLLVIGLPACILAPRALGLFFPVAGVACLPFLLLQGRNLPALLPRHSSLYLAGLLAFIILGAVQIHKPADHFNTYSGLLFNALAFSSIALATPLVVEANKILRWSAIGFSILLALLCIEWLFGMPINELIAGFKDKPANPLYTLDRTIITCALLAWPIGAYARAKGVAQHTLIAAAFILCGLVWQTSSQAAAVGTLAALIAFATVSLLPQLTFALLRPLAIAVVISAPFLLLLLAGFLAEHQNFWPAANSGERLDIWVFTVNNLLDAPWTGQGFEALRYLGTGDVLRIHPHNGILQIWLETGLVGILLAAFALGAFLSWLRNLNPQLRPWALAAFTTWAVVFCVGYNIWQVWWQATALLLAYLFLQLARTGAYSPICGRAEPNR